MAETSRRRHRLLQQRIASTTLSDLRGLSPRTTVMRNLFVFGSTKFTALKLSLTVIRASTTPTRADLGNRGIRVLAFGPETDLPCLFVEERVRQLRLGFYTYFMRKFVLGSTED